MNNGIAPMTVKTTASKMMGGLNADRLAYANNFPDGIRINFDKLTDQDMSGYTQILQDLILEAKELGADRLVVTNG